VIFTAQTIHGDFNHPALQRLRSSCCQRIEEYRPKIDDSLALLTRARSGNRKV
jgi:hypothetical protein